MSSCKSTRTSGRWSSAWTFGAATPATTPNGGVWGCGGGRRRARRSGRGGESAVVAGAVASRRHPVRARERLGELRRLAVADPGGDVADGDRGLGQQLGGALHADPGQTLPERCVAVLVEAALQLTARGGDLAGDVIERELCGVFGLHERDRLAREGRSGAKGGDALHALWCCVFPGPRAGDAPRAVAAHPPGVLDSVDLLVEPLAGLAAEDGGAERDCE